MREPLHNQRFDDIYFSPEDGLAETQHVFLDGNGLPQRWQGRERFTIAETGFGTGLNFLAAWALFEQTAKPGQVLDFVSFELYPLAKDVIADALEAWHDVLAGRLDKMLAAYPLRITGFHRVQLSPQVRLTLVLDDVNTALPQLTVPGGVDAWFLDGFAPSKNPEMWNERLYAQMARLSASGATAATFTVAGHVRRGLEAAGFDVRKAPGFGRKKDMTTARFTGSVRRALVPSTKKVAVIGGGLAGTSCAYVLGQRGIKVSVFEKGDRLAAGASGNRTGLYNPRFYAQRQPEADFYSAGYAQAVRTLRALTPSGYAGCGALHLMTSPEKEKRFRALADSGLWHADHLALLTAEESSEIAGVVVDYPAMYLPDAGVVYPQLLCSIYAGGMDVRLNSLVNHWDAGQVNGEHFDAVILACAAAATEFEPLSWLPVHTVRGQVSYVSASAQSENLRTALCYGGYIAPACDGEHTLGATFQKWLEDTDVCEEDHHENLEKLAACVPALNGLTARGGKSGLRTASKDRVPLIGRACDAQGDVIDGVFLSLAHGSHGIVSALAAAHLLADMIALTPHCLAQDGIESLFAGRFPARDRKRGGG
ncbi:MAG: bifunctional tRNA (5-methylaminomethyl-2-thiouridine)(34)-methyltransferase MnmD/FAD-dependent 5-carboxymethylaminomethyl-2-thiouridine(34) oxidoreductase MnmC [Rhodospirillales bacterium]|nr:bifunctional tRNA (5-methylaminomethyl-2-thiouridine)(34)-methyltransferase MnmD/FAD-dependent 5-carboxymethylaminomethyl-2-thiouridine(34) oxidoreductase MnmC [Rhodospirillales bacterium]MCB9994934.1 bifunctional tRNA (5-methylaminomethyl-2-thiouridine)(34)-methyltransferase MnmD/FAD-dependent 5-carboxymethylaminomethyl-2-thiouridine(34) oxidoreductase MnmC [Rhodospirillales bacterium]